MSSLLKRMLCIIYVAWRLLFCGRTVASPSVLCTMAFFYQLLLKQPNDIEPENSAKHYKLALENSGSSLVVKFPQPRAARKVDKEIDGDDGTPLVLAAPDRMLALADASGSDASSGSGSGSGNSSSSSSSSSNSKSGSASSSSDADSNDIEGDGVVMPSTIDGNRLVRESHGADTGFRVVCPPMAICATNSTA